jgi:ABC-2 type transport system ATP-binding protein
VDSYAIRTDALTRDFAAVRAVDHLTFSVPQGAILGFLGPNGAGKTTTIRLLLGLLEPTEGRAVVLGYDSRTQADEIRRRSGALLEHTGLYERLNGEDNLEFYSRVWHLGTSERRARIQELLTHLGLWERRRELVGKWSRGMKQKLAVARAMLHRPALLFLDEPTAGLDPGAAAALREDLAQLVAREGVTVFLTTHNLAEAEKLCGLVAVIRQGKLLDVGSPEALRTRQSTPRLEIRGRGLSEAVLATLRARAEVAQVEQRENRLLVDLRGAVDTAPLVSLMVGLGVEVEEVRRNEASLEEVFLTMTREEQ